MIEESRIGLMSVTNGYEVIGKIKEKIPHMTEWNDILTQLNKDRFKRTEDRWTTAKGLRLENEFSDADAIPYKKPTDPDINKPKFSTITTQVRKKKISKKSKKDRIAEKSVLLADRLTIQTYK
jgi:hypothetical protein